MTPRSVAVANLQGAFLKAVDVELPIYSLGKPFIASAVFASGIQTSTRIAHWIERDVVPRGDDISVGQLLNHTSGLRDYGGLPEYSRAIQSGETPWTDDVFTDLTLRRPLLFEPGQGWSYSNPGYWLLTQIVQLQTGMSIEDALRRFIFDPLDLSTTRMVHGQFADDLPWYPAEWVWHGLLTSTASDVVRFMMSPLVDPLLRKLTKVPIEHPKWSNPHNGYGLMVEPGVRYGHNGGGPNYSASCFHFIEHGLTGCVLIRADEEEAAMDELFQEINSYL